MVGYCQKTASLSRSTARADWRKSVGGIVGSHVLQNVRCALKGLLANLVHDDRVSAIVACHEGAACDASRRDVHGLSLRFIDGRC